jgi:hypothetical protein
MGLVRTELSLPIVGQGPPAGFVFDADVDREGHALFAIGEKTPEHLIFANGAWCSIPEEIRRVETSSRVFGPDVAFVANLRVASAEEPNAWLIDRGGAVLRSFPIGDGIKNFFRTQNFVVVTYFDEGVYGNTPQGQQGLSVFNLNGTFLWGWNSEIAGKQISQIDDCYSALPLGDDRIAVFSYSSFELVILDLATRFADVHVTPQRVHGAVLSMLDGIALFCAPYAARQSIIEWRLEDGRESEVARLEGQARRRIRGLSDGRFLELPLFQQPPLYGTTGATTVLTLAP